MNSEQRLQIRGLVKKYSDSGTESLIAFVADTNGMLAACQALLHSLDAEGSTSTEWLQRECSDGNVTFHAFLEEVVKIVALFQPSRNIEDHLATLGVSADASPDEIKQAYRILSRRYHPDTAAPPYRDNPEKFIAINKAYNALLSVDTKSEKDESAPPAKQWRRKKERSVSPEQRKKVFTWTFGLLVVLVIISAIASMNYQKRAMLAGLQESRGAFTHPARKTSDVSTGKEDKVDNKPTDIPAVKIETTKTHGQDLVAKVQPEPKVDPSKTQLKDLPRKEPIKTIATPPSPMIAVEESPKVGQPDAGEPNPAILPPSMEAKDAKILADKSPNPAVPADDIKKVKGTEEIASARPLIIKAASEKVVRHASEQDVRVESKAKKKSDNATIVRETEDRNTQPVALVETKTSDQPAHTSQIQNPRREQTDPIEPNVVFKIATPHSDTRTTDVKTEDKMRLADATVKEVLPLTAAPLLKADDQSRNEPNLQARLDSFFANYINAYEQRNLILFSRFFEGEAEENGKPFTSILSTTYLDLFAKTKRISMQVEERSWRLVDSMVSVDGRFKVELEYTDSRKVTGSGPIHFLLSENGSEILIKKMDYVFHTE